MSVVGAISADRQFGGGDRRDRDIIVVGEIGLDAALISFQRDQRAAVEDQSGH